MTDKVSGRDLELERDEVAHLLSSGIFHRAPGLERMLRYIGEKYLAGAADEIKEYNIAVEALGRPADFDQRKDSIVRVEAHRLRKRLQEYYAGEGSGRAIQVIIPPGKYVPEFVRRLEAEPPAGVEEGTRAPRQRTYAAAWVGVAAVLAASLAVGVIVTRRYRRELETASLPSGTVRILAGATEGGVDRDGDEWLADRYYTGGEARRAAGGVVRGDEDGMLYRSRREGAFRYEIPLRSGLYELRLFFAETEFGAGNTSGGEETSRIFRVLANGRPLLSDFDVASDAGANEEDSRVFAGIAPAPDGKLHLEFTGETGQAFVNAIEITPGDSGGLKPIRILCQQREYADRLGRVWSGDRHFRGGRLAERTPMVEGADDGELYAGERFGNLVYKIPVAPGKYDLTLRFAERWFGPGKVAGGGVGSRRFDIFCNGTALERDMDIFREAGGSDRALMKVFRGLEANPQGKLVLSLVPSVNYACIDAIEVTRAGGN